MEGLRIGITGSGYMGRTHAEAIAGLPGMHLVAISGGSRAPRLAEMYGVTCEPNVEALVARRDIDAIIITTPHHVHFREAIASIEAGKHVLVEKPMTTSVADCMQINKTAQLRKVTVGVGYYQRFRQNNRKARELLRSGAIGEIRTVQISMPLNFAGLQKDSGFGNSWTWWTNPASVGHIINGGTHAIDLLRWFMDSEVQAVTAISRTFRPNSTVEDTTMALFSFENGAICSLFSSCALPGVTFPGEGFRVRIMGTSGLLDLDLFGELKIADQHGWRLVCTQPRVGHDDSNSAFLPVRIQAYRDQLAAFLQAIRGETSECGTGRDGIAGVEACLAAIEASRKEAVIHLPAAS